MYPKFLKETLSKNGIDEHKMISLDEECSVMVQTSFLLGLSTLVASLFLAQLEMLA